MELNTLHKTKLIINGHNVWLEPRDGFTHGLDNAEALLGQAVDNVIGPISDDKPELSVPPGWHLITVGESISTLNYEFNPLVGWQRSLGSSCPPFLHEGESKRITQVIDINLSKQPLEFVAFTRGMNGTWHAHSKIPKYQEDGNCHVWAYAETSRTMVQSEQPKWIGPVKDSLLVRPEYWNKNERN